MRRYIAPPGISSFFVGGNYYTVKDGVLTVPDGVDIDVPVRRLGFTDAPAAADAPAARAAVIAKDAE